MVALVDKSAASTSNALTKILRKSLLSGLFSLIRPYHRCRHATGTGSTDVFTIVCLNPLTALPPPSAVLLW